MTLIKVPKVCNLFKPNLLEWDEHKIIVVFNDVDVKAILAIDIPQHTINDHIDWVHTTEGCYSLKSGYHFLTRQQLWSLKIPPNFKKKL